MQSWPPLKSSSRLKGQSLRHGGSRDFKRFPWVGLGMPELRCRSRRAGLPENRISGYRFQQQLKRECQDEDGECGYPLITSYSATHILSKVVSPWVMANKWQCLGATSSATPLCIWTILRPFEILTCPCRSCLPDPFRPSSFCQLYLSRACLHRALPEELTEEEIEKSILQQ